MNSESRMLASLFLTAAVLAADPPAAPLPDAVTLVGDEHPARIVVPAQLQPLTREALTLLIDYVAQSTGVALAYSSEDRLPADVVGPRLYLGRSRAVNERVGAVLDPAGPDAFVCRSEPGSVVLAGKTPFADRLAVLWFLHQHCGARWYMPGPLWEVVKRQRTLAVPVGAGGQTLQPAFRSRWRSGLNTKRATAANWRWANLNGAVTRYDFHHAPCRYFSAATFGKEHPDYYGLVNGRRVVPGPGSLSGWQLCMSNPAVADEFARIADARFRDNPDLLSISVTPNDGGDYCECDGCKALWGDDADERSSRTRLVFALVNAVARRLRETWPDRLVGICSYGNYRDPVPGLAIEPNVVVYVVGCRSTLEARTLQDQTLARWREAGVRRFGLYEWHHGSFFNVPPLYPHELAEALRAGAANGADGWYSEDYPSWALQGPAHWISARLLWDPGQDVDALLDEYCADLFGPAAAPMRTYFRRCEEQWTRFSTGGGMAKTDQYAAYPPAVRQELRARLDEAATLAANLALESERVRFFARAFGLSERMAAAHEAGTDALARIGQGDIGAALAALGRVSRPVDDPLLYLKLVLDDTPLALFYQSDTVESDFFTGTRNLLEGKIKIAAPVSTAAGQALLAAGTVTATAWQDALDTAFAAHLPATQTPDMHQAVAAVREFAGKAVFAPTAAAPPVIDGDLGDALWQGLPEQGGFYAYGGGGPARYATTFRMARHGDRLLAAFNCYQDMTKPRAGGATRDSNVWLDDAVEIFLNRADAATADEFLQVIVNVKGVIFDWWRKDVKWNGDVQVGTREYPDRWCLELSIPLAAVGLDPAAVRGLRLNIVRDVWGAGPGNPAQICPWFPTTFGHSDLNLRGWLFFP